MAESLKKVLDPHNKIGTYQEAAGGGTPMDKGDTIDYVASTPEDADKYKANHPGAIVRVDQPRDENGQFTYNSANNKKLKYGPSRGTTIPPFMRGVEIVYAQKSKNKSILSDGKMYVFPKGMSKEDLVRQAMEYMEDGEQWFTQLKQNQNINLRAGKKGQNAPQSETFGNARGGSAVVGETEGYTNAKAFNEYWQKYKSFHRRVSAVLYALKKKAPSATTTNNSFGGNSFTRPTAQQPTVPSGPAASGIKFNQFGGGASATANKGGGVTLANLRANLPKAKSQSAPANGGKLSDKGKASLLGKWKKS